MKKNIQDFIQRGFTACGFGPIVLAIIYLVLQKQAAVDTLSVDEVCRGIFSLSALAFVAGGVNVVHQMERVPLTVAILIQGIVLYVGYLGTYLVNDWLEWSELPILMFTGIFILLYLVIWGIIYVTTKKNTAELNEKLKQKQQNL